MFELIALGAAGVAAAGGYIKSKDFVRKKLRYVDAARSPAAPFVAGAVATAVAVPVVALLPIVGAGTALAFGVAVGAGTLSGAHSFREGSSD